MFNIQILTSVNTQFLSEWKKLWNKSPHTNIVNSPGWLQAALHAFKYTGIKIITIRDCKTGRLLAVAPFVKMKIYGVSLYTLPALEFADNTQILADFHNKELVSLLFLEISRLNGAYLPYVHEDLLKKTKKYLKSAKIFLGDIVPFIDSAKGPYGILPERKKNKLYNRLKHSQQQFKIIAFSPDPSVALEKTFKIDIASAKHTKGKGVFHRKDVREFYRRLSKNNPSNLIVTLIFLDNRPVSYLIGFFCRNIYSGSQKAYLSGYEYYNLGRLSLINLIDYFREKGLPVFLLGRGYDNFKKDFTRNYAQLYNIIISENPFPKFYIPFMYKLGNKIYKYLESHKTLYLLYKNLI